MQVTSTESNGFDIFTRHHTEDRVASLATA